MKIGFVVNDIKAEQPIYTTTRIAMQAINMGHEAWIISVGDLSYDPDEYIRATARMVPRCNYNHIQPTLKTYKVIGQKLNVSPLMNWIFCSYGTIPQTMPLTDLGHKTLDLFSEELQCGTV